MFSFLVSIAMIAGAVAVMLLLFGKALAGIPMLALIGLACLAMLGARVIQASNQQKALEQRLQAIFQVLANRDH